MSGRVRVTSKGDDEVVRILAKLPDPLELRDVITKIHVSSVNDADPGSDSEGWTYAKTTRSAGDDDGACHGGDKRVMWRGVALCCWKWGGLRAVGDGGRSKTPYYLYFSGYLYLGSF